MNQTIRIIGGQLRGKKLSFPDAEGLRPTPDRVRETLFNWLMHDIHGAVCLDAFAGSGALGFEAYSRGAKHVTFLEQEQRVYQNLLKVSSSFDATKFAIKRIDACAYLKETKQQFNLIFLDPPFAKNYLPQCLELLAHSDVLMPGGLLYIEAAEAIQMDFTMWQELKSKKAGQVVYGLYKRF